MFVYENGVFTAAGHAAYGSLTVRAGETTRTIPVYVTSDPLVLLDGFEGEQTVLTQNTDKSFVRFGSASARWDYRAENVPENAEELLLSVERTYAVPSGYDRVTLWVYGDGQRETLALTTDAGETNVAVIDFTGWQQLTFTLPDKAASITGFALRLPSALSGTLYLDQLVAAREGMSDTAAPEISVSLSEDGTALTGKVFDAVDGGSLATLRVTLDGKALSFTYDHQTGALHAVLPDVAWHNNMGASSWRKLAVNCVINPLTAIKGCKNGDLRDYPQEVAAICREVAAVMEREGIHTSAENLLFYVEQVIESTAENISSMLQDVRAQRHTEIDYITGFLLNRARAHGVAVPENARLFELIKRKENEYERVGTDLPRPW